MKKKNALLRKLEIKYLTKILDIELTSGVRLRFFRFYEIFPKTCNLKSNSQYDQLSWNESISWNVAQRKFKMGEIDIWL